MTEINSTFTRLNGDIRKCGIYKNKQRANNSQNETNVQELAGDN